MKLVRWRVIWNLDAYGSLLQSKSYRRPKVITMGLRSKREAQTAMCKFIPFAEKRSVPIGNEKKINYILI